MNEVHLKGLHMKRAHNGYPEQPNRDSRTYGSGAMTVEEMDFFALDKPDQLRNCLRI